MSHDDARLLVLRIDEANRYEFVAFWEKLYDGYDEAFYQENIKRPLTPERIQEWFKWKNGRSLSASKIKSIGRYSSEDERVEVDAGEAEVRSYLKQPGGAVWRIFFLHLQHPAKWPIYDQHVHRAMAIMLRHSSTDIPKHNPAKVDAYLDEYVPFFRSFDGIELRKVDRALWAFGKFLRTYQKTLIAKGGQ